MSPTKREFDCVEFKRRAQAAIHEKIRALTPQQEIEFFRKAASDSPLGARWARARSAPARRRAG